MGNYPVGKTTWLLVAAGLLLVGIPASVEGDESGGIRPKKEICRAAKAEASHVTCNDLASMIDEGREFVLLDIRTKAEYDAGHIQNAIWLPRGFLEFKIAEVVADPASPIVVYCLKGCRGSVAALTLEEMGYADVRDLEGGLEIWMQDKRSLWNMLGRFVVEEQSQKSPWPQ
jgi:rhodanese-related sulfurtransferase